MWVRSYPRLGGRLGDRLDQAVNLSTMSGDKPKPRVKRLSADELTDQRREEIRHAAVEVFAERGYREASIAQIAARLGIGHGTIYRYFKNKRAIAEFVIQHALTRFASVMAEEQPGATDSVAEYRAQVERICERLFNLLTEDPDIGRMIFVVAPEVDDELRAQIADAFTFVAAGTEQYLLNGIEKGFLDPELDTQATSFLLNSVILEAGRQLQRAADSAKESRRWIAAGCRLMFDGIAK